MQSFNNDSFMHKNDQYGEHQRRPGPLKMQQGQTLYILGNHIFSSKLMTQWLWVRVFKILNIITKSEHILTLSQITQRSIGGDLLQSYNF